MGLYGRQVVTLEAVRKAREKKIEIPLPANSINSGIILYVYICMYIIIYMINVLYIVLQYNNVV